MDALILEALHKIFPELDSKSDYDIFLALHKSEYIHKIKNYYEKNLHSERPTAQEIIDKVKEVFKKNFLLIIESNNPILKNYNFDRNSHIDSLNVQKQISSENKIVIEKNNFLICLNKEFLYPIIIYLTEQTINTNADNYEIKFSELQMYLNFFKTYYEFNKSQEFQSDITLRDGSLTDYFWRNKDDFKLRKNALRRKLVVENHENVINTLKFVGNNPHIIKANICKDIEYVEKISKDFFSLKYGLLSKIESTLNQNIHLLYSTPIIVPRSWFSLLDNGEMFVCAVNLRK